MWWPSKALRNPEMPYRPFKRLANGYGNRLQLGVLRFGFLENGDVGIGVFPKSKEILVARARFRGIALKAAGAGELKLCEGKENTELPKTLARPKSRILA